MRGGFEEASKSSVRLGGEGLGRWRGTRLSERGSMLLPISIRAS